MLVNVTTIHKRLNDTETNNYIHRRTAVNKKESPYCTVSFKRPRNDKCKTIKREKK